MYSTAQLLLKQAEVYASKPPPKASSHGFLLPTGIKIPLSPCPAIVSSDYLLSGSVAQRFFFPFLCFFGPFLLQPGSSLKISAYAVHQLRHLETGARIPINTRTKYCP